MRSSMDRERLEIRDCLTGSLPAFLSCDRFGEMPDASIKDAKSDSVKRKIAFRGV
jgi:hypothetical protein